MGRSRGGLTTKIHALVDALGPPIRRKLTEGQAHDGRATDDIYDTVSAGTIFLADRAYDSRHSSQTALTTALVHVFPRRFARQTCRPRRLAKHSADAEPYQTSGIQHLDLPIAQRR